MVLLVFAITNALAALTLLEQLARCGTADLSAREKPTNCCPSSSTKIIDCKLPLRKFPIESLACVSFS